MTSGLESYIASSPELKKYAAFPRISPVAAAHPHEVTATLLSLENLPAPMFWLMKVSAPWENEFIDTQTNPSMLEAAALPAITMSPNPFTEDCITTFESENMTP